MKAESCNKVSHLYHPVTAVISNQFNLCSPNPFYYFEANHRHHIIYSCKYHFFSWKHFCCVVSLTQGKHLYFSKSNQKRADFLLSGRHFLNRVFCPPPTWKANWIFCPAPLIRFLWHWDLTAAIAMGLRYICFHIGCDKRAGLPFSLFSLRFMNSLTEPCSGKDRYLKSGSAQNSAGQLIASMSAWMSQGKTDIFTAWTPPEWLKFLQEMWTFLSEKWHAGWQSSLTL